MSRSRRKTPIAGLACCQSEKKDKKRWHSDWRSKVRSLLKCEKYEEADKLKDRRHIINLWSLAKDGKKYYGSEYKHKKWYKKMMRK